MPNNDASSDDFLTPNESKNSTNTIQYVGGESLPEEKYEIFNFDDGSFTSDVKDSDGIGGISTKAKIRMSVEEDSLLVATIEVN